MEQFPGNSKQPIRSKDEPKKIERVVQGEVIRRKTPLGRRFVKYLIGDDDQSLWEYVVSEILIPGTRVMIWDGFTGSMERTLFRGESYRGRSRSSGRGRPLGHTAYNQISSPLGRHSREDPRREMSHRGRSSRDFGDVILASRVEAEEVLACLEDLSDRYEAVSIADLYVLLGVSGNYTDVKWGWTDLRGSSITRVHGRDGGYLLSLPKPEPID